MKTTIKQTVALSLAALASAACADGWVLFDREEGTWRVSGGAVMDSGVKTRLTTSPRVGYASPFVQGATAADALNRAQGVWVSATRRVYPNGAWIDSNDPGIAGDMPGYTGHYYFPGEPGQNNVGSVFSLGSASFSEVTTYGADAGLAGHNKREDSALPGFALELDRTLYRDDARSWGVDLGFGLQYLQRDNVFKSSSSWRSGSTVHEGEYGATIDTLDVYAGDDPNEDWNWRSDASGSYYGSGEPDALGNYGYAGPINGGAVQISSTDRYRYDSVSGSMRTKADYQNLELLFMARPYYDIFPWLRVIGSLGCAVSYHELDVSTTITRNGVSNHQSHSYDEWDVYGIAGIGLSVSYKDFTLGVDVMARFWDDELKVHDRNVNGTVERGDCFGRLMLGYSF